MSKNNRMHVVALQTTVAQLTSDKAALAQALGELGYCHDQQTAFITASMSGADGVISQATLLAEAKAALAEAVSTNKTLCDDIEFQEFRFEGQKQLVGQLGKTCADLTKQIVELTSSRHWSRVAAIAAVAVLAIGACYHLNGVL
jgi:hypothetical protein